MSLFRAISKLVRRGSAHRARPKRPSTALTFDLLDRRELPAVLTVSTACDSGAGSLRYAVDHASSGDDIIFNPGISSITLTTGQLDVDESITIDGASGGGHVTINGNAHDRVFKIESGIDVSLSDLTITNGAITSGQGAGIENEGDLTLTNCIVTGNATTTAHGAGLASVVGQVTAVGCEFSYNISDSSYGGGGIFSFYATINLQDCSIHDNSAGAGGGIQNVRGIISLDHCDVSNNSASNRGGGVDNAYAFSAVDHCTFSNNEANNGGGISTGGDDASFTLIDSSVFSNTASDSGGGIQSKYNGKLTLANCTIADNSATYYTGGGIDVYATNGIVILNTTISGNSAGWGGGISTYSTSALVWNSIVAVNTSAHSYPNISGEIEAHYDLIGDDDGCTLVSSSNNLTDQTDDQAGVAPLGYYGGPTPTMALLPSSEALGVGAAATALTASVNSTDTTLSVGNTSALGLIAGVSVVQVGDEKMLVTAIVNSTTLTVQRHANGTTAASHASSAGVFPAFDQRGQPRLRGGDLDIGAYQAQGDSLVVTTSDDPGRQYGVLSLREAVAVANVDAGDGQSDTITFAHDLSSDKIVLTQGQLELTGHNSSPTATIAIDGDGRISIDGDAASRVVFVDDDVIASLSNLTVTNGFIDSDQGAGIENYGNLTLTNCIVTGNVASTAGGGGIACVLGDVTLLGCEISWNSTGAGYSGGGILSFAGTVSLLDCAIDHNSSEVGGGIYNVASGNIRLDHCQVFENSATSHGGGIYNSSTLVASNDCSIFDNSSGANGGGVFNNGALVLSDTSMFGNSAAASGGAVSGQYAGTVTLGNCTIVDNSAIYGGGIDAFYASSFVLSSSTVSDNRATYGGGISNVATSNLLLNSIVARNQADAGPDLKGAFAASHTLVGVNDVYNQSGITDGVDGNKLGRTTEQAGLGLLGYYGGPTPTIPLLATSQALNHAAAPTTLTDTINSTDTELHLDDDTVLALIPGTSVIQIGDEQMLVTTVTDDQAISVERHYNGTSAVSHMYDAGVYPAFDQRGQSRLRGGAMDMGAYQSHPTAFVRSDDPSQSLQVPIAEAMVSPNTGNLSVAQPLDFDLNPGTSVGRNPYLTYNSNTVGPKPIIEIEVPTDASLGAAGSIVLDLIWDGHDKGLTTFTASGSAGDTYRLAVQMPDAVTTSGVYQWRIESSIRYSGTTVDDVFDGETPVVVNDASPFGAGWSISGIDQLYVGDQGVYWVNGAGQSRLLGNLAGGSSADDFGRMTKVSTGGSTSYDYIGVDQTHWRFVPSAGSPATIYNLDSVTDPHGLKTAYRYDSSDRFTQLVNYDGSTSSVSYGGTTAASIVEPGSRTVALALSGGDLASLTDAAGDGRTFTYSSHRLTRDQWAPFDTTFAYGSEGRVSAVKQGNGTGVTYTVAPEALAGMPTSPAVEASASLYGSITDPYTAAMKYGLDEHGREVFEQTPLGGVQSWQRNSHGQVVYSVDKFGRGATYTYSGPDLVEENDPDGSVTQWTYEPTFHHVTKTISDPAGGRKSTSVNSYDPATGDLLLTVTDPGTGAAATTAFAWSAGLQSSITDANGNATSYGYDADRRLTFVSSPAMTGNYSYDTAGNPDRTTTAAGYVDEDYSATNRPLVRRTIATNGTTTVGYSADVYQPAGQVAKHVEGLGSNTDSYSYDTAGRMKESYKYSTGFDYVTNFFDRANRVTSQADILGNATTYSFDADGNQLSFANSATDGSATYNTLDQILTQTDGEGNVTTFAYNALGLKTAQVSFDGSVGGGQVMTDEFWAYTGLDMVEHVDGAGNYTTFLFDGRHHVIQEIFYDDSTAEVSNRTWGFSGVGDVTTSRDADGNVTTYSHDGAGRVLQTVDAVGTESSTYDLMGHRTRFVDKSGNTISAVFDAAGRQTDQTLIGSGYAVSQGWRFDSAGRQNVTIDEAGRLVTDVFDAADRVIEHRAQQSGSTYATEYSSYSVEGLGTLSIDAAGLTTATTYDVAGRPTTIAMTGSGYSAALRYQYDPLGHQTFAVDGRGITTQTTYDLVGHPLVVNRGGFLTTTVYDDDGRDVQFTDSDGQFTNKIYDGDYLVTKTIAGPGSISETDVWDYDENGATTLAMVTRIANGVTSSYTTDTTYDSGRKVQQHVHTGGTALDNQTWGYDHAGNVTYHVDNDGKTTHTAFDADYRMITQQVDKVVGTAVSLWSYESWTYDGDGHVTDDVMTLTMAGSPQVRSHHWVYDPAGHVTRESQLYGGGTAVTTYSYDPAGRLLQLTDPNNNATTFGYDLAGNKIWTHDANGYTSTSEFDLANRETRTIDRNNKTHSTAYDVVGHKVREAWSDAQYTYDFDHNGNVTFASKYDTVTTYFNYTLGYDNLDRPTSVSEPFGSPLTLSYDGRGNRSLFQSGSFNESSTYDTANRLVHRFNSDQLTVDVQYDWLNRSATETRSASGTSVAMSNYAYDADNLLATLTQVNGSGTIAAYVNTYDAAGELTKRVDHGVTNAFTYSVSGELTSETNGVSPISAAYDGAGNRSDFSAAFGPMNELLSETGTTYANDHEGNRTAKTFAASSFTASSGSTYDASTTDTYVYNDENQLVTHLVSVEYYKSGTLAFGPVAFVEAHFSYGPFHERLGETDIRRYILNTVSSGTDVFSSGLFSSKDVHYSYDGWNPAKTGATGDAEWDVWADLDAANGDTQTARYLRGDGIDQTWGRYDTSVPSGESNAKWLFADQQGSIRDVTDASGTVKVKETYQAFGYESPLTNSGGVTSAQDYFGRYRWTGRESVMPGVATLQYNRGRYYDPITRRWLNQDPMGYNAGDNNLYRYVKNAPTNATDPSGYLPTSTPVGNFSLQGDAAHRELVLTVKIKLAFRHSWSDWWNNEVDWTDDRKNAFRAKVEGQFGIEGVWNNHSFRLFPTHDQFHDNSGRIFNIADGGKNGIKPIVKVDVVNEGEDLDMTVSSAKGQNARGNGAAYDRGTKHIEVFEDSLPRSMAHEFGHFLGLEHPGLYLPVAKRGPYILAANKQGANSEGWEYLPDSGSLMGNGSAMRGFYFQRWENEMNRLQPANVWKIGIDPTLPGANLGVKAWEMNVPEDIRGALPYVGGVYKYVRAGYTGLSEVKVAGP